MFNPVHYPNDRWRKSFEFTVAYPHIHIPIKLMDPPPKSVFTVDPILSRFSTQKTGPHGA